MGQPIVATQLPGLRHGTVRFELNRTLTGMSHERYSLEQPPAGVRPPDELARRLLDTGRVEAVHVHSNLVTVYLAAGGSDEGLKDVVEDLYRFYPGEDGEVRASPPGPNPLLGPATPEDAASGQLVE